MINSQYKKGFLRIAVLTYLAKKDRYGYEFSKELGEVFETPLSTIYPILYKLMDDGLVDTYLSDDSSGGIRKYYKINQKGHQEQAKMLEEWKYFSKQMNQFLDKFNN